MTTSTATTRKPLWKVLAPIAAILALVLAGLSIVKSQTPRPLHPEQKAAGVLPDMDLQIFQGGTKKLSELKAKVVLINFWATWCTACVIEMPSIVQLRNAYKDKGFEVVAVNLDEKPEAVVPKSLKQLGIDFPVYTDKEGKLAELFSVSAIPLTVIIDSNRKVLLSHNGERNWNNDETRAKIEGWLSK